MTERESPPVAAGGLRTDHKGQRERNPPIGGGATEQGSSMTLLDHALEAGRRGWHVFPLSTTVMPDGTKRVHPCRDWDGVSSADPAKIEEWFGGSGSARWTGYGIDCRKSGLGVVDLDGAAGILEWFELGGPTARFLVETPGGGEHHYYTDDPERPLKVSQKEVGRAIDTRGPGGFVVGPGSRDARGEYIGHWTGEEGELTPVPELVHERIGRRRETVPPPASGGLDDFSDFDAPARLFSLDEARTFVKPHMEALSNARRGAINGRLNDAAIVLAHFVPEFWSEKQATAWLLERQRQAWVASGGADDRDYAAALATIRSGLGAKVWKATLLEAPGAGGEFELAGTEDEGRKDPVDAMISRMLDTAGLDDIAPLSPLVDGWLYGDTLARLNGKPGSLKSFVALDMAGAVATGTTWHDRRVWAGPVVYMVAEGAHGLRKRVRAWEQARSKKMTGVYFLPEPIQTSADEDWAIFMAACVRLQPVLIVLDTQARITVGLEENSAKEMGVVVDRLERLRERTKACVLLVHHLGHNGEHGRGSTSVPAALQTELTCQKERLDDGSLTATLSVAKQKDDREQEPLTLRTRAMVVEIGQDGEADVTSLAFEDEEIDPAATRRTPLELDEELASMGKRHAMARLMLIMKELFSEGIGGTEAQIQKLCVRDKDDEGRPKVPVMGYSTFRKTWNRAVEMAYVMKIEKTSRWLWNGQEPSDCKPSN